MGPSFYRDQPWMYDVGAEEILNPKHEALNKFEILMFECSKQTVKGQIRFGHLDFENLNLFRISIFEFRIYGFCIKMTYTKFPVA